MIQTQVNESIAFIPYGRMNVHEQKRHDDKVTLNLYV